MFNVFPDNVVGTVFLTDYTFDASSVDTATSFAWDFGDSTVSYDGSIVNHTYKYPGIYTVTCSAWGTNNLPPQVFQRTVQLDFACPNQVVFSQIPSSYSIPGQKTNSPFVVSVTSTEIQDSLYLTLQSLNTNSIPFDSVPSKWNFITPTWRFIDAKTNQVITNGALVDSTPIYQEYNGELKVVAVSGEASFYYVDDTSTNFNQASGIPILLIASLSTETFVYPPDSQIYPYNSYANSDSAKAAVLWQIDRYFPTNLKVTENFISDTYPTKWNNVPIPVMVTPYFDSRLNSNFAYTPTITANILEYPRTNQIGQAYPIQLSLSNNLPYTVETNELYFSNTDENNNLNSGYVYTSITPTVSSNGLITVTASTSCIQPTVNSTSFGFPNGYPIYSSAYIFSPYNSLINKINLTNCPQTNEYIEYYKNLGVLSDGRVDILLPSIAQQTNLQTTQLTSSAQIYSLAVDPILNRTYVCDPLAGNIISLNFDGTQTQIISSVSLSSVFGMGGSIVSPSFVSVDQNHNVWISINNKKSILKFNSDLQFLYSATPTGYIDESTIAVPPIVKTDKTGNVWSCFAGTSAGYVAKFDTSGNQTSFVCLSTYSSSISVPVSLIVDANNSVWVACYNSNTIFNFSSGGSLVKTLTGSFTRPNNLAVDNQNNIWFTHGYNFISQYKASTGQTNTWQIDTTNVVSVSSLETNPVYPIPFQREGIWGGLAIDVYNRVWAIDSVKNKVAVFNSQNISNIRVVNALPSLTTTIVPLSVGSVDIPTSFVRSFQSAGDWTGNEWYQKYATPIHVSPVSGTSTPFTVFELDGSFGVAKVNEEFDAAAYLQSLALPEPLLQSPLFFTEFLAAVAGDGDPTSESAGRVIYERIANFVQTHGDFETAEIDQLLSYATQLSVTAKTYGVNFPAEISRLLNIFSVPKNRLRGRVNYDPDINNNIGPILTQTDTVSAGQYLFAKQKQYNNFEIVYVTALDDGTEVYPLTELSIPGFKQPLVDNYYFFQYLQTKLGYTENIINWDSDYTTFDYTLSSNADWYGDNGLIETLFNNILTKRLTE
jgi:streptogramin lyase